MSRRGHGRGGSRGRGESRAADPVTITLSALAPGEWKSLRDFTTQPSGPEDVAPALTLANFAINTGGTDWRDDWANVSPGSGTPPATDADVAATIVDAPNSVISAWGSSVVVDKGPGHCQIYLPGGGGHANYGGNECYSFDIQAACASINAGGAGGVWARLNDPCRYAHARDGSGSVLRGYNPNYPYTDLQSGLTGFRFSPYDSADPLGSDQRHVGPIASHLYGGLFYDDELDAIVIYGGAGFRLAISPEGFWLWSIPNQRYELLPADHALGAGEQAVDGAFSLYQAAVAAFEFTLIKIDTLKYWFGKKTDSFRVKLDGTTYSSHVLASPNTMAQRTGTWGLPVGHNYNITSGPGAWAIAAPFDTASPPGASSSNLAAWIFVNDDSAGGGGGWALIWPNIAIEDDYTNNTYIDYANDMPNSGGEILPDVASGVYSAAHDAFFFPHKSWLADFDGQIYAFDRSTLTWVTYNSGGVGDAPGQSLDMKANGAHGHFTYLPDRDCFSFVYDSDVSAGGKVLLCKGSGDIVLPSSVQYVDAIMMHGTPVESNEFDTWAGAKSYFSGHADIIAGTHRGRLTYEYSTTPYDETQVPNIAVANQQYWSLQCIGETGGASTAINDSYDGDNPTYQTDTFAWSTPGGVVSPLGMGDIVVKRNGVTLRPVRDYQFTYDTYDFNTTGEYPSLSGEITLVAWADGSPAAPASNPLGAGETLTITSVEARPIFDVASGNPVDLVAQKPNPEMEDPPKLVDFYGVENLVITQHADVHSGNVNLRSVNWRIKNCFIFRVGGNGINDNPAQQVGAPMVRGQQEIIDTTIFDCGHNSDLSHNVYLGKAANVVLDNVVSTDCALPYTGVGRSMKIKATDKVYITGSLFAGHCISEWMGATTSDEPDNLSLITEPTETVIEDTIFYKHASGSFFIVCTGRKSPLNEAIGDHGPGPGRLVYLMQNLDENYASPLSSTTIVALEENHSVSAGTTQFTWQQVTGWDAWSPANTGDLIVGVWDGTDGHDMTRIPSDGFSATNLDGASSSGIIDLSGGASPSYPSGVPEGASVFVSAHFKPDRTDYWTDTFWANVKICGVFAAGFASGTTASVNWSSTALNQGPTDTPVDADFHVSVNGTTFVLDTDYTVTGGGTSSGSINFSPSLSDGDFYTITSDAHKTQRVTPVIDENVHSWYYNNYFNPSTPITEWAPGDGYKWPTVKQMFVRGCEFYHDSGAETTEAIIATSTRPLADDISDVEKTDPVPDGWRERFMTFASGNSRWNVPTMFEGTNVSWWGGNVVSPYYHVSVSDTVDGTAPTDPVTDDLLPDWWLTTDNAPERIAT